MTDPILAWLSIILGPLLAVAGIIFAAVRTRKTGQEANEIDRFEALLQGYEAQRKLDAAQRIDDASRITKLETDVSELKKRDINRTLELAQVKKIVHDWFQMLVADYRESGRSMPLPTDEELMILGIDPPAVR